MRKKNMLKILVPSWNSCKQRWLFDTKKNQLGKNSQSIWSEHNLSIRAATDWTISIAEYKNESDIESGDNCAVLFLWMFVFTVNLDGVKNKNFYRMEVRLQSARLFFKLCCKIEK